MPSWFWWKQVALMPGHVNNRKPISFTSSTERKTLQSAGILLQVSSITMLRERGSGYQKRRSRERSQSKKCHRLMYEFPNGSAAISHVAVFKVSALSLTQ
jgi:hypothetical protein